MTKADGYIGRPMRRREDPPLVQGRGSYAADHNPTGTVHLAIRRAGVPRAKGLKVDVSAASRLPGVAGAWTFGPRSRRGGDDRGAGGSRQRGRDALYSMGYEVCVDSVPVTLLKLWSLMHGTRRPGSSAGPT